MTAIFKVISESIKDRVLFDYFIRLFIKIEVSVVNYCNQKHKVNEVDE